MSKHCKKNGETYWEHLRFAVGLSWDLWKMSLSMLVHGLLPDWARFDGRIMPFTKDLKNKLVHREMAAVHKQMMAKALEQAQAATKEPSNGKLNGGSNGSL